MAGRVRASGVEAAQPARAKAPPAAAAAPAPKRAAASGDGAFESLEAWAEKISTPAKSGKTSGLPAFSSYYPAAKKSPKLPAGQPTVDTFDEPQMRALHRAYWSAPATASLPEMVALAVKDPAFAKRKEPVDERQVGRLFAKQPESFPWGWRSRALAATSHVLIDALLQSPKGTAVTKVLEQLEKDHPGFPTLPAFSKAARTAWLEEPERFPFAAKLEKTPGGYKIEARGAAAAVHRDKLDRFVINEALAKAVAELAARPEVRYDWTQEDFLAFADKALGGGFTRSTFNVLRERFPKILPSYTEIRSEAMKRLAELIREIYESGVTDNAEIMVALHKEHGFPLWKRTMLTYFRLQYPDIVPEFRAIKDEGAISDARALLDEIKANPEKSYREVGLELGHGNSRVKELVSLIHRRWSDELPPQYKAPNYTLADKKMLQRAIDDAPLNATVADVMRVIETESPEFFEQHPFSSPESFYVSIMKVLELESWRQLQRERYTHAFADLVKRSPPGTTLHDLITHLQDEHQGAYSRTQVVRLVQEWKAHPKKWPQITALQDKNGAFPWERSKVRYSEALAKRVGQEIAKNPSLPLRKVVGRLLSDSKFRAEYPTLNVDHVHHLRGRYPKLVPFVDELTISGKKARHVAWAARYDELVARVEKEAAKVEDQSGLTVAYLARRLKLKPHRVLHAIRRAPELFPWYRERPTGELDLRVATKVAHEMEQAPLGTTLQDILQKLKADPGFSARYPSFNYHSIQRLRERYPELVPHWYNRDAILRSKLIVDALVTAKKGASFSSVIAGLEAEHPGRFGGKWSKPSHVLSTWAENPALFPFVAELGKTPKLEGQGKTLRAETETPAELATRLSKLERITERLPLLDKLAEGLHAETFADHEFLAIQHLLGPQVAMFETMREKGMKPGRTTIVGIPYSISDAVADTLQDKGWDVRLPPLDLESWYLEVKKAMEERIESAKKNNRKIVVIDDGGLAAMMFERYPHLAAEAHRFRIVEQTTRGITVADGVSLESPVVNVAQSWGKFVEGPMIGDVVAEKLMSRLEGIDVKSLKGKHVGVIGAGTIGLPLAEYLRSQGAIVTVRDNSEAGRQRAAEAGFAVEKDSKKFFGKQDIIIGATGHRSITAEDLGHLKKGAIIGSASSKLVEIDVDALAASSKNKRPEVIDKNTFPPTVRYHLKDGRTVDLIARGFPLNFDGDVESVASEKIQLTMGLLMVGAIQAANIDAAGVRRMDPKAQLKLLDAFEAVGGIEASGPEVKEALALAKQRLATMAKKHGVADRRHGAA